MTIVITVLIAVVALIAIFLVVALFVKKGYSVEREIAINKSKQEVFNYLKHLKNQEHFSKWVMMDPAMKKEYKGMDGNVGFVYAWDGNKQAGAGEQEIKNIVEGERLEVEVRFKRPISGVAYTPFLTEALSDNATRVKWGMSTELKYPMNIMLLFLNMDKILGADMQASLATLKRRLEQ